MSKSALGRGLGALLTRQPFASNPTAPPPSPFHQETRSTTPAQDPESGETLLILPIAQLRPSALQPRRDFSLESLQELADSIREQGIIQPLIARKREDHFELIAGERRWRASQMAHLKEVPVIVREADDTTVLEWMLIENLQRKDLNPIEEAQGYSQLIEQFNLRQEDVATKVGRSRVSVANALRLLRLPSELQVHIRESRLSVGHAKVLLGLVTVGEQTMAAEKVLKQGLNVRQTEILVAAMQKEASSGTLTTRTSSQARPHNAHLADLATKIQQRLGTKVGLRYNRGKGCVEIKFFSDADLERILQILGVELN